MNMPYMDATDRYGAKYANFAILFREIALVIDANPDKIFEYCDEPSIQFLLTDQSSTSYERTCFLEAFSYGDPGVVLACPGPSLSGLIIRELGTQEQVDMFYALLENEKARTFFALTEPLKGSDAGALQSQLILQNCKGNKYFLNGEKCLFGNGAVGKIGVILARTHPGPLGIRAVLITAEELDPNKGWIHRENLSMTGLRGAQIAYMRFNNCPVSSDMLLGQHLRPMQRGMMAVMKTFNKFRSGVGALGIGQAQAVLDYLYMSKKNWNSTEKSIYADLYYKLESARQLLRLAAKKSDSNPYDSYHVSISKVQATKTSEYVVATSIAMLDPAIFLENQWLAKCYRDSFAWEYMEGTRNMQLKNVYQKFQSNVENHTNNNYLNLMND